MQFLENEIHEITQLVWTTTLQHEIHPAFPFASSGSQEDGLVGCVYIKGNWKGVIALHCSSGLARQIAALMFDVSEQAATHDMTVDALGELANMVGGNIKALLPSPCQLSLPTVAEGVDCSSLVPGGKVVSNIEFEFRGESVLVSLIMEETGS
jgi:chemotaxis protein CheX